MSKQTTSKNFGAVITLSSAEVKTQYGSSDYHTIQVPRVDKKKQYPTRKAELENDQLETILSQRDFYSDVWYVVAVHAHSEAPYKLEDLKLAMECPRFIPYLGRKANPTGLYLKPTIAEGDMKVAVQFVCKRVP